MIEVDDRTLPNTPAAHNNCDRARVRAHDTHKQPHINMSLGDTKVMAGGGGWSKTE